MFPTLPALVLALALAPQRPLRRGALIGTLVVSIVVVAGLVQLWSERYPGAVGLHDLLWTGKGVTTGWAGLTWDKAWMMLSGVGNYFLIVGGWVDPLSAKRTAGPLIASVLLQGRSSSSPLSWCCGRAGMSRACAPSPSSSSARWAQDRC